MKVLLTTLFSCVFFLANALDTNKKYYIFHSSGMVLSAVDGRPNLHTFDATNGQVFQFSATGNTYFIKSVSQNKNVAKTGDWDTELSSSTGNVAKFSIEDCGGEYVRFKCAANNLYLGTDGIAPGSYVYSDKNGKETLHFWFLREASSSVLVTDGLQGIINKAEDRLASTSEGDGGGEYPSSARKSLQNAIDEAKTALGNASSQTNIVSATKDLNSAITAYNNSRNLPFSSGKKYYVVHASNRFLTNTGNGVSIKNAAYNASQQFTIETLSDGTYALKSVSGNNYLNATGEYNTNFTNSSNNSSAHLKIAYAPNEDKYVRIQFSSNNKYLGTDGTSDGKGVYSDKSGSDGKHYWMLIPVDSQIGQPYTQFHIGSPALRLGVNWNDADGKHINAHGGCVLYKDGVYYWFGENYRANPVKSNGIVCYTSTDLYNWKYECMAYKCPEAPLRNDNQDMNYGRTLERPKVMYCPNTGKYVMWVHWENGSGYAASRVAILYSDKITGPYTFVKTMRPRGDAQPSGSRDQTLMYDPDYKVGYHFGSAEENMTMHGTLLTNDYLDLSPTWERMFVKKQYEAPAIFKYHKRFVAITSGCTGWDPNPAHSSYSQMPLSGWEDLGNPCVDDEKATTYHSQSNYVFKVPGKYDAYIYMGDRWKGGDYFSDANVGESWHIWLPIDMRTGYPIIRFYSDWDLSIFDKINRYRRVKKFEDGKTYVLLSKNANRILSVKDGRMQLTEDNDDINLSLKVTRTDDGFYKLTDENKNMALDATNGQLTMAPVSNTPSQRWKITDSGTHDGYFYLSPAGDSKVALTNFSATPTSNGVVGLNNASKTTSCQFAFCFDSEKYNMETITDESDGTYDRWMQSMGFELTDVDNHINESQKHDENIHVYSTDKGIVISSEDDVDIRIWTINGQMLDSFELKAGDQKEIPLPKGVYVVNGEKVMVG